MNGIKRQYSTSFHLVLTPEDLCERLDCKWCKGMRVIFKLESQKRASASFGRPSIVDRSRHALDVIPADITLLNNSSILPSKKPTHISRYNTPATEIHGQTVHKDLSNSINSSPFKQDDRVDNPGFKRESDEAKTYLSESPSKTTNSRLNIHAPEFSLSKEPSPEPFPKRQVFDVNAPVFVPSNAKRPASSQEPTGSEDNEGLIYSTIEHPYTSIDSSSEFKSQSRLAYDLHRLHPHSSIDPHSSIGTTNRYARMLVKSFEDTSVRNNVGFIVCY
jgi:hypothetical protein